MDFGQYRPWLRRTGRGICLVMSLAAVSLTAIAAPQAKSAPAKSAPARSVYQDAPSDYTRVGDADIYYKMLPESFDIIGGLNGRYYGSTYGNRGYRAVMKVDNGYACALDPTGSQVDGVTFHTSIEQQGIFARVTFTLTNTDAEVDKTISLGAYADVMIGDNDRAPIVRRLDTTGNPYGMVMSDGSGAQLCVLFGNGLAGVTPVSDFWFGYYGLNNSNDRIVGDYTTDSSYMEENGSYDSGMGWCWKDKVIPAGSTVSFSFLMGVGDANMEPNSSFAVTTDDIEGWNDLSRPHIINISGDYESPAGQAGCIEYTVEDSDEWLRLTDLLDSGTHFEASITVNFTQGLPQHQIRFRTVDAVGNTADLLPIVYRDINACEFSNIGDLVYTGHKAQHSGIISDLSDDQYTVTYRGECVNAGNWTADVIGVFPHTIGKKSYSFAITPARLSGSILLEETDFTYTGFECRPGFTFTSDSGLSPEQGTDYKVSYYDNVNAGRGRIVLQGTGNYTDTVSATFNIAKAPVTADIYNVISPDPLNEGLTYSGNSFAVTIQYPDGIGTPHLRYICDGMEMEEDQLPVDAGTYECWLRFDEGLNYLASDESLVANFRIYRFDESEWNLLMSLYDKLKESGFKYTWDTSDIRKVTEIQQLHVKGGHITDIYIDYSTGNSLELPEEFFMFPSLTNLQISGCHFTGDIAAIAEKSLARLGTAALPASISTIYMTDNDLTGNIGRLAELLHGLKFLWASGNCFMEVSPEIASDVTADLSLQRLDKTFDIHLATLDTATLYESMPQIVRGTFDPETGSAGELSFSVIPVTGYGPESSVAIGNNRIYFSITPDGIGKFSTSYNGSDFKFPSGQLMKATVSGNFANGAQRSLETYISLGYDQGDANFDGRVNTGDLRSIALHIFGQYALLGIPFNYNAADLYADSETSIINVQDMVVLTNLILDSGTQALRAPLRADADNIADTNDSEIRILIENGSVTMSNPSETGAFDLTVKGAGTFIPSEALKRAGFITAMRSTGTGVRVIGYSPTPATLPAGTMLLGHVTGEAEAVNIEIADADGNVSSDARSIITGISGTAADGVVITRNGTQLNIAMPGDDLFDWQIIDLSGFVIAGGSDRQHVSISVATEAPVIVRVNGVARIIKP